MSEDMLKGIEMSEAAVDTLRHLVDKEMTDVDTIRVAELVIVELIRVTATANDVPKKNQKEVYIKAATQFSSNIKSMLKIAARDL